MPVQHAQPPVLNRSLQARNGCGTLLKAQLTPMDKALMARGKNSLFGQHHVNLMFKLLRMGDKTYFNHNAVPLRYDRRGVG